MEAMLWWVEMDRAWTITYLCADLQSRVWMGCSVTHAKVLREGTCLLPMYGRQGQRAVPEV